MRLEMILDQREIPYKKLWHRQAFTAQEMAAEQHVPGYEVAKPVVVCGKRGFAMCVLAAPDRLDLNEAARVLGEEKLRLATEEEMKSLFPDCELGAEPPVGKLYGLRTVMDERLRDDERIFLQAGTHTTALRMRRTDWEQLCEPVVGNITRSAKGGNGSVPMRKFSIA